MDKLIALVQHKFPNCQVSPLKGGGTNALFLLENLRNRTVLKLSMVSISRASVEEKCLSFLAIKRIAPRLLKSLIIDGRIGLQMDYIDGSSLLSLILKDYNSSNDLVYPIFSYLGRLLAELHDFDIDDKMELPKIVFETPSPKAYIDDRLYKRSQKLLLNHMNAATQKPVLLHGDFGYHNVIRDVKGNMKIIDWEFAGFGDPRVDVANVLFWTHLHFPTIALDCGRAFMGAYIDKRKADFSQDVLQSYVIFQIWRILEIVTDEFPKPVKIEWNRRLNWALDHVFV